MCSRLLCKSYTINDSTAWRTFICRKGTLSSLHKPHQMIRFPLIILPVILLATCTPRTQRTDFPDRYKNAAEYNNKLQTIIASDSAIAFDAGIRLNSEEEKANLVLKNMQSSLLKYYDSIHFFPPAKHFFKSKTHIYSTPLFGLLKQMPKGAVQHLHPSAAVSFHWIVERAVREKDCYVFWEESNAVNLKGELAFFKAGTAPKGFYSTVQLNKSVTNFKTKLYELLIFDDSMMADSTDIWKEFEFRFKRIEAFNSYQPVTEDFYVSLFDSLAADGVQHVELRTHLSDNLYDLEHARGYYTGDSVIKYIQNAVQRTRANREPNFSCALIYTNVRFYPVEVIKADLVRAFEFRSKYPQLVKAYDLVAHEDAGYTTRFYLDAWLSRDSLARAYSIDLPFCFHDGESTWQHLSNVYDAVMLKTRRLGHGFNLSFFPAAEAEVIRSETCVEVSPLSNQILGYITDLRLHPAHAWIKHGMQISISPDDPSIFGYTGVTPDYWSIFLAWELDLRSLKQLAINSIRYSFLEERQKKNALENWNKKWIDFIQVINKYGNR
jgi:adenosine deaminase CECR1